MTAALHSLFLTWLNDPNPVRAAHARRKLSDRDSGQLVRLDLDDWRSTWSTLARAEQFHRHGAVRRCPARVRDPSCGCTGRGCALLGRPIEIEDCLSCVAPLVAATLRGLPAPRAVDGTTKPR